MGKVLPGRVVANFRLPGRNGEIVTLWQFKQRQPVVLVLWEGADAGFLDGFATNYERYRRLGAEVLAIGREEPTTDLPFPVLRDTRGTTIAALADAHPAVLILDSFGELFNRWQGDAARQPDHEDLLDWVLFTEIQCEECGPHAENWPRREP